MFKLYGYCLLLTTFLLLWSCGANNQVDIAEKKLAFDTSTMDRSVSPCHDFDNFVNGNWKKTTQLPKGYSRWGSFLELIDDNDKKINGIIHKLVSKQNKPGSEDQQISDLYLSYMDTVTLEQLGIKPLESWFERIEAVQNKADFLSVLTDLNKFGFGFLANYLIDADAKNSNQNALYVMQQRLSIGDRDYYLLKTPEINNIRNKFVDYVQRLLISFGHSEHKAAMQAKMILNLETELAKIQLSKVERRDPIKTYNKIPFVDLQKIYPEVPLYTILVNQGVKLDSVIVESPKFLAELNKLLQKQSLEVLKTYLNWRIVNYFASSTTHKNELIVHSFYGEVLSGVKEQKSREKRAVKFLSSTLGEILGKKYADLYFSPSSKEKIGKMIENVRSVYKDRILKNDWMKEETKKAAIDKLLSFKYKIGYPDKWKDYSSIKIDKYKLIENLLAINEWEHAEQLKKIGKPVDKSEWFMTADQVNAYYSSEYNEIVFPAGILQPPFYNPDADDAINYGAIMGVIAHEFTHGFDDQGSRYDGNGNLSDWWAPEDRHKFELKAKSLGRLYANYNGLASGGKINPGFTMGENIADLGGLTLAYYALLKSLEGKKEPEKIDGFTYKQRFFLGWAQVWRSISTKEQEKQLLINDSHSPARARINVALSNLREFSDAWGCQEKDSMYVKKDNSVVIW